MMILPNDYVSLRSEPITDRKLLSSE